MWKVWKTCPHILWIINISSRYMWKVWKKYNGDTRRKVLHNFRELSTIFGSLFTSSIFFASNRVIWFPDLFTLISACFVESVENSSTHFVDNQCIGTIYVDNVEKL